MTWMDLLTQPALLLYAVMAKSIVQRRHGILVYIS
jgi:hypothetical protein